MNLTEQLANQTVHLQKGNGIPSAVISVLIILLNGTSLVVIYTNRVLETKMKVIFIGHLFTDLLLGVSCLVGSNPELRRMYNSLCFINIYAAFTFGTTTGLMTLLQTVDRFCGIRFAYSYTARIDAPKMVAMVVFIYVLSLGMVLATVYISYEDGRDCYIFTACGKAVYVLLGSMFALCLISIICMYIYIGKTAHRHIKQIRDTYVGTLIDSKEQKNIITIALIVGLYIVCYLPTVIACFYIIYYWETRLKYAEENPLFLAVNLYLANSMLNPIVYIWRLKSQRLQCRNRCLKLREPS